MSTAGLVLFNEARTHVVLQLRSAWVDHPNTWAFPGGEVDWDETATEAALREAWEEAHIRPERVAVEQTIRRGAYTYVIGTGHWTPDMDPVLPHSANSEAQGARWVPVSVLDSPEKHPRMRLHPLLAKGWPKVRERMGVSA